MEIFTKTGVFIPKEASNSKLKLYSWNVNGIRSVTKKGALQELLDREKPDCLCIQETKAKFGTFMDEIADKTTFPGYAKLYNDAKRPGYSGTVTFLRSPDFEDYFRGFPEDIAKDYNWEDDQYGNPLDEGRVQVTELKHFYLVNVYTPNSKRDLSRLGLRESLWDPAFLRLLKSLEQTKPVVVCGDFNAAHTPLDLARPKDNTHNAGFTQEERQGIKNLIAAGFVDTFRYLHPDEQRYTWWSHWSHARERNIGWRIDYFFISESLLPNLKSSEIHEQIQGSDHCPVSIELEF